MMVEPDCLKITYMLTKQKCIYCLNYGQHLLSQSLRRVPI